jgi:hypothetical protein
VNGRVVSFFRGSGTQRVEYTSPIIEVVITVGTGRGGRIID